LLIFVAKLAACIVGATTDICGARTRHCLPAIERTPGPISAYTGTVDKLRRALESAGIEFSNGDQPGVRLTSTAAKPIDRSE
jgi:hypothetical protein